MERKPQRKIEPVMPDTKGDATPLKKHLSQDDLASKTHKGYMDRLNEARKREKEEDDKKGNSSSQTQP